MLPPDESGAAALDAARKVLGSTVAK